MEIESVFDSKFQKAVYEWICKEKYDVGLFLASRCGSMKLAEYFIGRGATNFSESINEACMHQHLDIAELIYVYYRQKPNANVDMELLNTEFVSSKHSVWVDRIRFWGNHGAHEEIKNKKLRSAARHGFVAIVRTMLECGATDLNGAVFSACFDHPDSDCHDERLMMQKMKCASVLFDEGAKILFTTRMNPYIYVCLLNFGLYRHLDCFHSQFSSVKAIHGKRCRKITTTLNRKLPTDIIVHIVLKFVLFECHQR